MNINYRSIYIQNLIIIFLFLIFSIALAISKNPKHNISNTNINIQYFNNQGVKNLESKYTIYYIWATWCSVCKANINISHWNYNLSNYFGINYISLEEGENLDKLREFLNGEKINYPIGLLNDNISEQFNITEYPTYIYIKDNNIYMKDSGIVNPISFLLRILYLKII